MNKLRVCFIFRTKGDCRIGGVQRSMLRLMQATHLEVFECCVLLYGEGDPSFKELLTSENITVHHTRDLVGLYKYLKWLQPDVVYMFARVHAVFWGAVAKLLGIPVVVAAVRGAADTRADWVCQRFGKYFVDAYLANSQAAAKRLRESSVLEERIFTIYNSVESVEPSFAAVPNDLDVGSPSIVCVANIQPIKGHRFLLEAVAQLRQQFPGIRAVLVGSDFTDGKFFEEMEALKLTDTYTWTGYISDIWGVLASADVFVLPSLSEGMPTAIMEAMVMGKPIVATKVGGVSELVEDGMTGLLVTPGDPKALADAIERVLVSGDYARGLGTRARDYVLTRHSISKMIARHVEVFQQLLNRTTRDRGLV